MKKSVILLCGPGCCPACPEVFENAVASEAQQIEIRDDFTNTVKMCFPGLILSRAIVLLRRNESLTPFALVKARMVSQRVVLQ